MFKEGDKYIHFTKYGSINKGEVQSCGYTTSIDIFNLVTYKVQHIISTKGIMLYLDGSDGKIYKVEEEITPEAAKRIQGVIDMMVDTKKANTNR
jgi:hypothetical protein